MAELTVFGGGSWGTALAASAAASGHSVCLWCRRSEQARAITATGKNPDYLRDIVKDFHKLSVLCLLFSVCFCDHSLKVLAVSHYLKYCTEDIPVLIAINTLVHKMHPIIKCI